MQQGPLKDVKLSYNGYIICASDNELLDQVQERISVAFKKDLGRSGI